MENPVFPNHFQHNHPPLQDVRKEYESGLTVNQRAADWVAKNIGSWRFIIWETIILTFWCILNVTAWIRQWDPYPFIFLNLVVSLEGAYTAPIIMMSQNRQADRDRMEAHNDYLVNQIAEEEIHVIMDHLEAQERALAAICEELGKIREKVGA
jgi:uncharacterized membrane protein